LATTICQPHYFIVLMLQDVTVVIPQRLDTARITGQNIGSEERSRERVTYIKEGKQLRFPRPPVCSQAGCNNCSMLIFTSRKSVQYWTDIL
jgi:hypothetical protein